MLFRERRSNIIALLLTLALGLFFLAGMIIIKLTRSHGVIEYISLCLAAIAMVYLLAYDLVPEIIENYELKDFWKPIVFILIGIGILKALDKFVPEHDAHDSSKDESLVHIGIMTAVAIFLHNILEGMTVYSVAVREFGAGISLGLGVGLHNIPMGMLIYSSLEKEKGRGKIGIYVLTIFSTFLGGLLMAFLSQYLTEGVLSLFECITVGMVLFILIFELIPSILKGPSKGEGV